MIPKDVRKMTRREISAMIDAMVSRKLGYNQVEESATVEVSPKFEEAVERARRQRFGDK